jgi:hypothetical protein
MRHLSFLLLSILVLSACIHNPKQLDKNKILPSKSVSTDLPRTISTQIIDSTQSIYIADSSYYSMSFLESLKTDSYYRKIYLNKDQIIINDKDTAYSPDVPPLGKELHFSNKKNSVKIDLYVKKTLLSTIEYKIDLIDNGKQAFKSGIANLSPRFFVGPEIDGDDSTN